MGMLDGGSWGEGEPDGLLGVGRDLTLQQRAVGVGAPSISSVRETAVASNGALTRPKRPRSGATHGGSDLNWKGFQGVAKWLIDVLVKLPRYVVLGPERPKAQTVGVVQTGTQQIDPQAKAILGSPR